MEIDYVLSQGFKIYIFTMMFSVFKAEKNNCVLHWHVFVMGVSGVSYSVCNDDTTIQTFN